jgi:hypothetical protein
MGCEVVWLQWNICLLNFVRTVRSSPLCYFGDFSFSCVHSADLVFGPLPVLWSLCSSQAKVFCSCASLWLSPVLFLFFLPPLGLCQDPEICFPACLICAQQRICYSLVGDEDSFFIPGFASFSLTVCSIWSGLCAPPVRAVCGSRVFNLLDWVCNWLSARDCRQLLDLTEYIFFWLDFLVLSLLIDFANHETWIEK